MSARKVSGKNRYIISSANDYRYEKQNIHTLGVLTTNILGTCFSLFDYNKASIQKNERIGAQILASINYVYSYYNLLTTNNLFI